MPLSAEERSDPTLDMLSGFVILDGDIRIVVVEGLRQQGKALDRLVKSLPREKPNDHLIKFLYNKNIGFPTRAYVDFSQPLILKQARRRPEPAGARAHDIIGIELRTLFGGDS